MLDDVVGGLQRITPLRKHSTPNQKGYARSYGPEACDTLPSIFDLHVHHCSHPQQISTLCIAIIKATLGLKFCRGNTTNMGFPLKSTLCLKGELRSDMDIHLLKWHIFVSIVLKVSPFRIFFNKNDIKLWITNHNISWYKLKHYKCHYPLTNIWLVWTLF